MAEMGESDLALEDHRIAAVRFRPMPSAQVVAKPRISIDRRYVYLKSTAFRKRGQNAVLTLAEWT
jgi:hypothetical protein